MDGISSFALIVLLMGFGPQAWCFLSWLSAATYGDIFDEQEENKKVWIGTTIIQIIALIVIKIHHHA